MYFFYNSTQATFTGLKKDYTESSDSLLTYVNKAPITTGILYDRVMSFSDLDWLKENGTITNSNYQHFIQSWSELYRSAYNPTFSSLETLKTNINSNTNTNIVDIGIINTKMNYIDFGTPSNPSLTNTGGYLYNVAGINPFLEKQVTVISPLKEKVESGTVSFKLSSSFILQLTGLPIKNLTANFGTGTTYNLITNTVISTTNPTVTFTTSGKKEFVFTVTFSNNTTETLKATLDIIIPDTSTMAFASASYNPIENFTGTSGIVTNSIENTIPFQGYNETSATKGILEYRTYYNPATNPEGTTKKIKKEIIILDGFDPGDSRKIDGLYQLMYYTENGDQVNIVEKLRILGFDVTLVNFPNGTDYVERNAMALVALLKRENAKLVANGSTEKIAIIGPSMGGLVSRYALAYMEKNGLNHNTKLWVSFDSPHLGANIPVGAQENLYFYGYKGRQDKAKTKFDENFRSPAARQMLIEQLDFIQENAPYPTNLMPNGTVPNGGNNNTLFRQQFQNNLNSNGLVGSSGYPQNLRKIALINGTTNGAKTNSEGQMFLELAFFKIIKYGQIFGTPIQTKIKGATIEDRFLGTSNSITQTFSGRATYFTGWNNNFPVIVNGTVTRININPRGSMDNVQGGTFNTQGIIKDQFNAELEQLPGRKSIEWRQYLPNHAFIPTVSSLAFKNPNFNWSTALNRNLVCDPNNKEIYFDSYFAPNKNEEHVFVSSENANWLIKELQDIPQAPRFPIETGLLVGPDLICNTNATYVFLDICKIPSAVTWSVSSNLQIDSYSDYSVSVSQITNGQGTITATFQNGQTITKTIWVGKPSFYLEYNYFESQPVKSTVDMVSDQSSLSISQQGITSTQFIGIKNGVTVFNITGNYFAVRANMNSVDKIFAYATNTCGTTMVELNWLESFKQSNNTVTNNNFYTIYPNPSNDIVNIDIRDKNNLPDKNAIITGELFDMMGQSKSKVEISNNKATFSVRGLNKGIYVLKIYINDKVESHQIMVE